MPLVAVLILVAKPLLANGWEWHSIPRKALIAALASEQTATKIYAIRAFGYRRDKVVVPQLIGLAASPEQLLAIRRAAIRALANIRDRRAVASLVASLRAEPSPELRGLSAAALGEIGGDASLVAIAKAFKSETALLARIEMIAAFGRFRDRRAVAPLAALLASAKSTNIRRRAAIALGQGRHPAATQALAEAVERPQNQSFTGDLVDAIGRTGGPGAAPPLTALMGRSRDPLLRIRITIALGSITDGDASKLLIKLLDDPRPPIRFHAIRGLATSGNKTAAPALMTAYDAIATDKTTHPLDHLLALTLRYEIVRALTALDPVGAAAILRKAANTAQFPRNSAVMLRLNEARYELRRAAIWGLGYSDAAKTVEYLLRSAIGDRDFRIRSVATRSLGVLNRTAALPALLQRLRDPVAEVRWQAAIVLGRLKSEIPVPPLIAGLKDPHPEVRRQAALALGYLGAKSAAAMLARLAADKSAKVRAAARQAHGLVTAPKLKD